MFRPCILVALLLCFLTHLLPALCKSQNISESPIISATSGITHTTTINEANTTNGHEGSAKINFTVQANDISSTLINSTNSVTLLSGEVLNKTTAAIIGASVSSTTLLSTSTSEVQITTIPNGRASSLTACTVGWLWWKKKILIGRVRFNVKKCELQYCTPSLEVELFTCKNLLAMIVPPAYTEELINEWKLECVKHKCIPA